MTKKIIKYKRKCIYCGSVHVEEDKDFSCAFYVWYDCLTCKQSFEVQRKEPQIVKKANQNLSY